MTFIDLKKICDIILIIMYILFGQNVEDGIYEEGVVDDNTYDYPDNINADEWHNSEGKDERSHSLEFIGVFSSIENAFSWKDRSRLFDRFFLHYDVKMDIMYDEPMRIIEENKRLNFDHFSYDVLYSVNSRCLP